MYEGLQNISWGCLLVDENVNTAFLVQQKVVGCSDGKKKRLQNSIPLPKT